LYRTLKNAKHCNYFSSDFEDEFLADYKFDITNIKQENNKFDTIICYHILEHIVDDFKTFEELHRILKSTGKLYIQTPFKEGDIYEDFSITEAKDRMSHFGQNNHVRIYSVEGLQKRLESKGFVVNVNTFKTNTNQDSYFGFISPEIVFVALIQGT